MTRAWLLLVVGVLAGCPGPKPALLPTKADHNGVVPARASRSASGFRLRNADDDAPSEAPRHLTSPLPLADAEAQKIIARLPPLPVAAPKDVFLRDASAPPPRAGKTITEPFPPPTVMTPPSVVTGPLAIERRAPEGNVAIAPSLAITFSRPMVALGSVDQPVPTPPVLTPRPPGAWQWIGAQTLVFQPEPRFAMATTFTVEVPAGTRSATGEALGSRQAWTFTTPPPKILRSHPSGKSESRSPLLFIELDQAIDPAALLGSIDLRAGTERVALRLATSAEIAAAPNEAVTNLVNAAEKNRWVAFAPVTRLAGATAYTATVRAGAPSAEGPRRTEKDQSFSFTTHGAMRLERVACGGEESSGRTIGPGHCPPLSPIRLDFANAIDKKTFDANAIEITPRPSSFKVERSGSAIYVHALTKGRTKYTLTVPATLGDVHGQTLGDPQRIEINVGSAEPALFEAEQEMVVLDPASPRTYTIYSVNERSVRARVLSVKPEDWPAYAAWTRDPKKHALPGKVVFDRIVDPKPAVDELVATPIALDPALTQGIGQAIVLVESTRPRTKERPDKDEVRVWVQSTHIGAAAFIESDRVTGWATNLADGAPLAGAEIVLLGAGSATTDKDGLGRIALGAPNEVGTLVYARKGADTVIVPERWLGETRISHAADRDRVRWLVYDDRGLYRPGEDVRIKGWVRRAVMGVGGDLDRLKNVRSLGWVAKDARGAPIAKGTASIDPDGSFDLLFHLPESANLEDANVELALDGAQDLEGTTSFHHVALAEFRRPEFEVGAHVSDGPQVSGGHAIVTADAKYYAGGALSAAKVEWSVRRSAATFAPPNLREYHFGPDPELLRAGDEEPPPLVKWTGTTNASGEHRLRVDFDPLDPPVPMALAFEASIEDRNHQQWTATTSVLVHPSSEYVGLRPAKAFLQAGDPIDVDVIVATIDGKRVERSVAVRKARLEYDDDDREQEVEPSTCETTTHCRFDTKDAGRYRITAIVADAAGKRSLTSTTVWVTGGADRTRRGSPQRLEASKVTLVPDKTTHRPGEVLQLLVASPFVPAEGVLTVRRQGIVHLERFTMTTASRTLDVKIEDAHVPNVEVRVDLVGARDGHPAWAGAAVPIKVLPADRALQVKATARPQQLEPGGATQIDVDVKDASGSPVQDARVAVVIADEAVLALSEYATPDPFDVFYAPRGIDVREMGMRDHVVLEGSAPDPRRLALMSGDRDADGIPDSLDKCPDRPETYNGLEDGDGCPDRGRIVLSEVTITDAKHIKARKNFSPLALFAPKVTTDRAGHASIPVKMPDNLTRYRIMTVASFGDRQFGSTESAITARLPMMVRASPPRFATFGDRFDLPVIVQNQTDAPLDAGVVLRASNATVDGPFAKRVLVPPNDRAEVRFAVTASGAGMARLQAGASAGTALADAAEITFPVHAPATTEAFAAYGEIDQGSVVQPVKLPANALPDIGGLEITTSSTALQALTDAVLYLVRYPYECAEQIASRVLAVSALKDVLAAFQAEGLPPPATLIESMKADLERLERQQDPSGGWGFWAGGAPWPFLSVHVMHALERAEEKGFKVDAEVLAKGRTYLATIEQQLPAWYPPEARSSTIAYALYVRNRLGDPDPARARKLLAEPELSLEAVGWIWPTLAHDPQIAKLVANRVTETAGTAHFASGYSDATYLLLRSDRRADALLLEAMIAEEPSSTLIPKLVKGLLEHRTAGHWSTTQENAFVLLALDRYFQTFEKTTPDFVARVWLGDRYAGEHAFRGRMTERSTIAIPMNLVTSSDLILSKDGPGRLYWRAGMKYAPKEARLPPIDRGFAVTRRYEAVDRPDDVKRDADGTWRIKAGARVRVRLAMVARSRRYHVALVDPLPAGLEPMNPALAVTGTIPRDPKADPHGDWSDTWYEHQNLRDDRVEAFASLLWEGVHEYVYVARATTAGTFSAPAPKAEEMYAPETFGRGASDRVIIAE